MGCCSGSSVRTSPALQPLPGNHSAANQSKVATGVLNKNNAFGEEVHVLRQIQNIEPPKIYSTKQLNLSTDEYNLVNNSLYAMSHALSGIRKVHHASHLRPDAFNVQKEMGRAINSQLKWSSVLRDRIKDLDNQKINFNKPLLKNACVRIEQAANFLGDEDKLKSLIKNPDAEKFFNIHKFDAQTVYFFNTVMVKILSDEIPKNLQCITLDERESLISMTQDYACKGIIEQQLPEIKNHFAKMQGKLDKDFMEIIGNAIQETEIGLENINHPERAAIFEKISPKLRPTSYGNCVNSYSVFKGQKSALEDKTNEEIADIFCQLKKIPLLLS